ncbi:hypothetical protein VVR12_01800 [Rothia sp. LK2588]|uniref:hypothetical protein n=1 Tax=Rothia sp. LK2588 TaxID=3114369 RepID=UPI0034CD02AB
MSPQKIKLKVNNEAFRKIRNLPEVRKHLKHKAQQIADIASRGGEVEGYVVTDLVLEDPRGASSVYAYGHAYNSNRKHNSLIKALNRVKE